MGKFPLISTEAGYHRQGKNTKHVQLLPTVSKNGRGSFSGGSRIHHKSCIQKITSILF